MKPLIYLPVTIFVLLLVASATHQQVGSVNAQSRVGLMSNSIDGTNDQDDADVDQKMVTTSRPNDLDYDDDDDDDEDEDDDKDESRKQPEVPLTVSTLVPSTEKTPKSMKVCVSLSPAHASTRNGPFVSYECAARLCSDEDDFSSLDDDSTKFPVDMYKFRHPLFDWNSQFAHLLLVNGTCDSSMLNCWHKIDVNVDSLTDAMEMDGVERIEIRCAVADYVRSFDAMNYVFGEATSVLKYFPGNRAHEPCNTTQDCGENMLCSQNDDTSLLTEDNSSGFCECPTEQMVAGEGNLPATLRSFILVEDRHYLEQVCVPLRTLNETCQYEQQCRAVDVNMECRETVTEEGVTTSVSVCACADGFKWSVGYAPRAKCIPNSSSQIRGDSNDVIDQDKASTAESEEGTSSEPTSTNSNEFVYIWWIFPPSLDESSSSTASRPKSSHGVLYYGSRMFNLSNVAYLMMLLAILVPLVIICITLLFYCHRKLSQVRQYQPRRASFTDSIYFPDNIPSTPSEKTKSVTFGFGPTETVTPPSSPSAFKKSHSIKKKSEDKLDLVDNDQLEQVHRFP